MKLLGAIENHEDAQDVRLCAVVLQAIAAQLTRRAAEGQDSTVQL